MKFWYAVALLVLTFVALALWAESVHNRECGRLFNAARTHADTIVVATSRPIMHSGLCGVPK